MVLCILGASGMLGATLRFELSRAPNLDVWGTVRDKSRSTKMASVTCGQHLITGVDAYDFDSVARALSSLRPEVVINCIGLIRQLPLGQRPLPCIEINARFPHLLLGLCRKIGARLIHYSTDCVFDGKLGRAYTEADPCTAKDIYGLSKYLGEINEEPGLTIRTSIIGPELQSKHGLLEWFLSQKGTVNGYRKAIYTGLPSVEHARILAEVILPKPDLFGLYQVAAPPISKYELLKLIAKEYGLSTKVRPVDNVVEDKRLSSEKFELNTGYSAPGWEYLVAMMHQNHISMKGLYDACPERPVR